MLCIDCSFLSLGFYLSGYISAFISIMPDVGEDKRIQLVFITPQHAMQEDGQTLVMSFKHPKTNVPAKFLVVKKELLVKIFELKKHSEEHCAWFVGNYVLSDGSMFIATPFDPLFFALTSLQTAQHGKFVLLNQIITSPEVLAALNGYDLDHIADSVGEDGMKAYRYNEEKALAWLRMKVERLKSVLSETGVFVWDASSTNESCTKSEQLRYACGMIGDYIKDDLYKELLSSFNVSEKVEKRKSSTENSSGKRAKIEPTEDYSCMTSGAVSEKKAKLTRSQKVLDKVDKKGMKSLDSFFKPKAKK